MATDSSINAWEETPVEVDACGATAPAPPPVHLGQEVGKIGRLSNIYLFGSIVPPLISLVRLKVGACCVERHITLDRAMWGSDQAASLEPQGVMRLVRDIRVIEQALGDGIKNVYDSEVPICDKLRRVK